MTTNWTERDRIERNRKETLRDIAPEVCKLLGEGWRVKERRAEDVAEFPLPNHVDLLGPDDACIGINVNGYDKTAHVFTSFEDRLDGYQFWYLPYKTTRPSINVSIERGAKAVASEIQRRILPEYLPLLKACNDARVHHLYRRSTGVVAAKALAEVIGAEWHEKGAADGTFEVNTYQSQGLKGTFFDVKVKGAGPETDDVPTVTFDRVTVPVEVGAKILALLAANHKPEED